MSFTFDFNAPTASTITSHIAVQKAADDPQKAKDEKNAAARAEAARGKGKDLLAKAKQNVADQGIVDNPSKPAVWTTNGSYRNANPPQPATTAAGSSASGMSQGIPAAAHDPKPLILPYLGHTVPNTTAAQASTQPVVPLAQSSAQAPAQPVATDENNDPAATPSTAPIQTASGNTVSAPAQDQSQQHKTQSFTASTTYAAPAQSTTAASNTYSQTVYFQPPAPQLQTSATPLHAAYGNIYQQSSHQWQAQPQYETQYYGCQQTQTPWTSTPPTQTHVFSGNAFPTAYNGNTTYHQHRTSSAANPSTQPKSRHGIHQQHPLYLRTPTMSESTAHNLPIFGRTILTNEHPITATEYRRQQNDAAFEKWRKSLYRPPIDLVLPPTRNHHNFFISRIHRPQTHVVQPVEPVRKVNVNVRLLKADLDVPRPWWSAEEYRKSIIPGYVPEYEPLVDYSEVEREKRREKVRRFFEGVERGWGVVVVGAWGVVRLVLGAVLALVWLVVWAFGGDVRGWR